jgi:hypothetical protein
MTLMIGLGHKARQGKDFVSKYMQEALPSLVQTYSFAGELKKEVLSAFQDSTHPYWQFLNDTRHCSVSGFIERINWTPDTCWSWTGKQNEHGYGIFYTSEQPNYRATRYLWKYVLGLELPDVLMHTCDNPNCVNPLHLLPGTKETNSKDMVQKERSANGERHSQATLTDHEVKQIRLLYSMGFSQTEICKSLELKSGTVSRIVNNLSRVKETTHVEKTTLVILSFSDNWLTDENKFRFSKLLQNYGTEFARKQDCDYWVDAVAERIAEDQPEIAIITDVRFPNEAAYVKENGGYTVDVVRRLEDGTQYLDPGRDPKHPSETALDDYNFDYIISVRDGDLASLKAKALAVLTNILIEEGKRKYAGDSTLNSDSTGAY